MKPPSVHAAYAFAFEVLQVWHSGRAYDPDPEQFRGGTGAMGTVHRAMDIMLIADRHDPGRENGRWFPLVFVGQPQPIHWLPWQMRKIDEAICRACQEMTRRGLIEPSECKRAGCPMQKA